MGKKQTILLISGAPGVGKSTLAQGIARHFSWVLLDKDRIDNPFSPDDRGEKYTQEIEPKVLKALLNLAELNLEVGLSVILDVPWTHILINSPHWIKEIQSLSDDSSARILVFECTLEEQALRHRIRERGFARDKIKLSEKGWKEFTKRDCIDQKNPMSHVAIDMSEDKKICMNRALKILTRF